MFEAFRDYGGPTYYSAQHIPWQTDLVVSGFIFAFAILAFSFYIILPGFAGKEKWYTFTRITMSLFIGAVILTTNFAMTWETAETDTRTKFKAGTGKEVNVTVGVNIGLKGVNITLKGEKDQIQGETIDYNEHFSWDGLQGRPGFGPFAGEFNRDYRAAQVRGLPLPILWAAEYFTYDGEGIRWGRHYRQAGWYAHIMLWLAVPLWILANFLFFVLLRYGAYMLALTGLSMLTANIIWATYRNSLELEIRFTSNDILSFSYGASFWLCLVTGAICVVLGIAIFILDKLCPGPIAVFFGVDVLQDSESILVEEEFETEEAGGGIDNHAAEADGHTSPNDLRVPDNDDDEIYTPPPGARERTPSPSTSNRAKSYKVNMERGFSKTSYRTREHRITKRLQRPRRRDPPPGHSGVSGEPQDDGHYSNIAYTARQDSGSDRGPPSIVSSKASQGEDAVVIAGGNIELTNFQHG